MSDDGDRRAPCPYCGESIRLVDGKFVRHLSRRIVKGWEEERDCPGTGQAVAPPF